MVHGFERPELRSFKSMHPSHSSGNYYLSLLFSFTQHLGLDLALISVQSSKNIAHFLEKTADLSMRKLIFEVTTGCVIPS